MRSTFLSTFLFLFLSGLESESGFVQSEAIKFGIEVKGSGTLSGSGSRSRSGAGDGRSGGHNSGLGGLTLGGLLLNTISNVQKI